MSMCPKHKAQWDKWVFMPPETARRIANAQQGIAFVQIGKPDPVGAMHRRAKALYDLIREQSTSIERWCADGTGATCSDTVEGDKVDNAKIEHDD